MAYFPRGGFGHVGGLWLVTDSNKTFSVTPATIDVPPLKFCTFSVSFKPVSKSVLMLISPWVGWGHVGGCGSVSDSNKTFSVTPDTIDVPPLKSCTFSVSFKSVSKSVPIAYFPRDGVGHKGSSGSVSDSNKTFSVTCSFTQVLYFQCFL